MCIMYTILVYCIVIFFSFLSLIHFTFTKQYILVYSCVSFLLNTVQQCRVYIEWLKISLCARTFMYISLMFLYKWLCETPHFKLKTKKQKNWSVVADSIPWLLSRSRHLFKEYEWHKMFIHSFPLWNDLIIC